MRRWYLVILWLAVFASPARADFADGLRAFDAGDYAEAVAVWTPLAAAGDNDALLALAGAYRQGLGIPADLGKAIALYRRAAAQGDAVAQVNLAEFYAHGTGLERDLTTAYMWFELAARQDHFWAEMQRDEIRASMTPAEISEAQRRANAWTPRPSADGATIR